MTDLPQGVPYIDLLVPPGTSANAADIQTRIELSGSAGWSVRTDDGTMERSMVPLQPLRGSNERIQVYRQEPMMPGEPLAGPTQLVVDLAIHTRAPLAMLGVYGVYAWGLVAMEDLRWLQGLLLLDWIYNPRIDEAGEIIESDDPADADRAFPKKLRAFAELWTPERAMELGKKLPDRAIQDIEGHQVLMMLGPGGIFDPRFWQSLSLQLGIEGIRAWAAEGKGGGKKAAGPGPGSSAEGGVSGSMPSTGSPVHGSAAVGEEPSPPPAPDDGLTPLALARLKAEQRAADATEEAGEEAALPEATELEQEGTPVTWSEGPRGPLVFVPGARYGSGWLRDLRRGEVDGLARAERPGGELLERWIAAGSHFVTEVSSVSRLLRDNLPLHKGGWDAAACEEEGGSTLTCQLPRVAQVRAIWLPPGDDGTSRILVSSDLDLDLSEVVATAG